MTTATASVSAPAADWLGSLDFEQLPEAAQRAFRDLAACLARDLEAKVCGSERTSADEAMIQTTTTMMPVPAVPFVAKDDGSGTAAATSSSALIAIENGAGASSGMMRV